MSFSASDDATFALTHDLGAPIRHILAFSTLLEEKEGAELDAESRDLIDQVQRAAELAQSMLEGLNRIARLGASGDVTTRVQISDVIPDVPVPEGFQIDLEGDGTLVSDPALLRELFAELARNAAQHGRVARLEVIAQPTDAGVRLRVSDGGPGLDPDRWARLRLPFRRGSGRACRESLGLGLAVVDKIVRLHGGTVEVQAASEGGRWQLVIELCALAPGQP